MSAGVLLPPRCPSPASLAQPIEALKARFGGLETLVFYGPLEERDCYRQQFGDVEYRQAEPGDALQHAVMVVVEGDAGQGCGPALGLLARLELPDGCRHYRLERRGIFRLIRGEQSRLVDQTEYPFLDSHIFNRLSEIGDGRKVAERYAFFPYGYLFHYLGYGPINAFGHRITQDLKALAQRGPRHKVIACFGGSACWSTFCIHNQMWTHVLEMMLNARARDRGLDLTFSVLNFGAPSNVVLNEIITYILFAQPLTPDVVIAHDGYNDLIVGQVNDPFLLGQHQIAYVDTFEEWAQILHNSGDRPRTQPADGRRTINAAPAILKAYAARKRQFMDIAAASGSLFVWGLQPGYFSKGTLSDNERQATADPNHAAPYGQQVLSMLPLYRLLTERLSPPAGACAIDFHTAFHAYGADETLFVDHVHLTPAGDRRIAEGYADLLADRLFANPTPEEVS